MSSRVSPRQVRSGNGLAWKAGGLESSSPTFSPTGSGIYRPWSCALRASALSPRATYCVGAPTQSNPAALRLAHDRAGTGSSSWQRDHDGRRRSSSTPARAGCNRAPPLLEATSLFEATSCSTRARVTREKRRRTRARSVSVSTWGAKNWCALREIWRFTGRTLILAPHRLPIAEFARARPDDRQRKVRRALSGLTRRSPSLTDRSCCRRQPPASIHQKIDGTQLFSYAGRSWPLGAVPARARRLPRPGARAAPLSAPASSGRPCPRTSRDGRWRTRCGLAGAPIVYASPSSWRIQSAGGVRRSLASRAAPVLPRPASPRDS
jgi:hypothetical protein